MKKIILQLAFTVLMLVSAGSVYGQTAVANTIRLTSLSPANGGTTSTATPLIISSDDSSITIDAEGVVTIASDYTPTAASGNTTGKVSIAGAKDKTISIQMNAGSVVDQTAGTSFGAITTLAGIQRSGDGGIGVTIDGNSSGIDNGEGINFGLDLTNIPSTLAVEITAVYLSTFGASETCVAVNRQDTSKSLNLAGFTSNLGRKDISTLGISIPGGTVDLDAVSFFSLNAASSFRITSIEIKIVEIPQGTLNAVDNLIRLNSLTGNQTITPNGTTSIQSPLNLVTLDDSNISVDALGVVTVESDYNPKAAQPISGTTNTTGTVQIAGAKSKTFSIRLSAGAVMNQTPGVPEFGAITTTGGIQRALDGGIGVTTNGGSAGIDNGKGLNFGLNLSNLPSTVSVEITAVYVSTFGLAESCKIVNRQDTSKNTTVTGFETNSGRIDISSLGILIPGGTTDLDAASFISPDAASNFRITGIELKVIDTTLGVKDQTAAFSRKFMVSQNPNTEMISIEYDASAMQNISASLIDINGRIIDNKSSKNTVNNTILFEGNSLKSGVYLVKISNGTNSFTKKIIKK